MGKFTIEGMRKTLTSELLKAADENISKSGAEWDLFGFSNKDLNTIGGVVASTHSRGGSVMKFLPDDIPRLIRKNGATNAIFFLKIGAWELNDGVWGYKGWICWNSVKIPVKSISGFQTLLSAYRAGTERLFGVVEEARIALKLKNMAAKRIQKLEIEFESKE